MEKTAKKRNIFRGVQFKFVGLMAALIVVLFGLLNTYPLITSRDLVFSEKQSAMTGQAAVLSSSLATLERLSKESISEVMNMLDLTEYNRIVVTDAAGTVVYDTSAGNNLVGRASGLDAVNTALRGKTVFTSKFSGGAFASCAAMPVSNSRGTVGAVYIYEYDTEQAQLIISIQNRIRTISLAVCVVALIIDAFMTQLLTKRIRALVESIRTVAGGDYGHRFAVTGDDEVTELGEEFNALTERLETTEKQRRQFVSDASHELKTPLASIRLLSDSIVQNDNMDVDTMREFVSDIGSEADRLQHTTEKLLDLSRLDDGVMVEEEPVDMKQVTMDALWLLRPLAMEKDVHLHPELEDGCVVMATVDDIHHIVFNLAENAVKYNVPGGSVALKLHDGGDRVEFLVEDTGIGIPEEERLNVFSRFYRVDKARSRASGGSGLGLSIVHDAVVKHGGTITVGANKPNGTRFTVTFPKPTSEETGI
jgi:signal transduction histidine kinase